MAEGTTAMGRTRMHDMMQLGYSVTVDVRMANGIPQGSFGATRRVRRKPSIDSDLTISFVGRRRSGRPLWVTMGVSERGQSVARTCREE